MQSRKIDVIQGAAVGACVGGLFGMGIGYLLSGVRVCSLMPGYFDTALSHSTESIQQGISAAVSPYTSYVKDKATNMAESVSNIFHFNPTGSTVVSTLKSVANKLPIAKLVTASISNPILATASQSAYSITVEAIKTGLYTTCLETMNAYKVIPIAGFFGALTGASMGAAITILQTKVKNKIH